MFVGRLQPLKAPDVLLRAVALLLERDPSLRSRLLVPVVGGPVRLRARAPRGAGRRSPPSLGIADVVRFVPPVSRDELVDWYAAATLVCVPSYNESFGLVAMEASAVGTPVVAAAVGGLTTVVRHGVTGSSSTATTPSRLREGHRHGWPSSPAYRDRLGAAAALHAQASRGSGPPTSPSTSTGRQPARCATT